MQTLPLRVDSVVLQRRENRWRFAYGYLVVLGVGVVIGFVGYAGFGVPTPRFAIALAVLAGVLGAILLRPIAGVYLTVFLSVLGDGATMYAYPFNFNFSSTRSLLYIADSLTFSPLELCIAFTVVSWLAHAYGARAWHLLGRPLLWPVLAFGGLLVVGLAYGLGVGGNTTVAMWELRPLLYMIAIYVLASNLFTRTVQYVRLAWLIVLAISIQNLFSIRHYLALSAAQRDALEALTEHPTSLLYNFIFLLALVLCLFRGCSRWARILVIAAAIPSIWMFVLSQRRAAFIALVAGFLVVALVLCFRRRKVFLVLAPLVLLITVGYTAAFWNSTDSGIGFGAIALKSVVSPNSLSEKDASSDLYRRIENYDLVFTAHSKPLTGVGFGKPFYRPVPLQDISFDVFYEYIPHNSIMWIWLKTGYFGFVALLFVIAVALRAGIRASMRLPTGDALAVTVAALTFIVMFVIFAFVDIAWSAQICITLAVCFAICGNVVRLAKNNGEIPDETFDETEFEAFDELTRPSVPVSQ